MSTPVLRRSSDGVVAGVLDAIAARLGWDTGRLRIAYVALSVVTAGFPGTALYLALWFVMPSASEFSGRRSDLRDI
jgi:phage shock protein PspC (stress-responsive transcriptional regulator)